jgi:c-di-GMP-binding flagellar brake protein YcgR
MFEIKKYLQVNQLVQIEIIADSGIPKRYPSRVENLKEKAIFLVTPLKDRIPVFISPGSQLNIVFWDRNAVYTFSTSLIKNIKGSVYLLMVAIPESIERIQQREFVRVESIFAVSLTYLDNEGKEVHIPCQTRDISGGGLQLVLTKTTLPEKGTNVQLEFTLNNKQIKATAALVWSNRILDRDGKEQTIIAVKFTNILEVDRQAIIKEVYLRQIELRRKGLL